MARKACQFHEENEGPPVTHRDALMAVGMADPLQVNKAVAMMCNLTAENGAFHHLTVEKKYVETSAKAAEERQVPRGRSVIKMGERRIKAVDDAKVKVERMESLPVEFKEAVFGLGDAIVDGAGRAQNVDRTADLIEFKKELAALTDKFIRKQTERAERAEVRAERAEAEVQFLRGLAQTLGRPGQASGQAPGQAIVPN